MRTLMMCLLAGAMLATQTPMVFAQSAQSSLHDWSTVKAIGIDERLIVKKKDGKTVEGKMIEATDTNLSLTRDSKVVQIAKNDIQLIFHSTGRAAKGKWALIGAAIGAGSGAGLGGIPYSPSRDDSEIYVSMGALIGAGVGAATGTMFGASRRHRTLIYTAP